MVCKCWNVPYRSFVRILKLLLCIFIPINSTVTYSPLGEWLPGSQDICNRYMCTPSNLTWTFKPRIEYYTPKQACNGLVAKGIKKIYFYGDSYMRQIYAAMLITLNGDYRFGTLANSTLTPHCEYHRQFFEKKCGTRDLNHYGVMCDGKVIMDPILWDINNLNHCNDKNGSVVIWSFGNYRTKKQGRYGVNDPIAYQQSFEKDLCPILSQDMNGPQQFAGTIATHPCSMWWISTHYRMRAIYEDEVPEKVKAYNEGMRDYFDSKRCGRVNYVDVYNMTRLLGQNHSTDALAMTYDQVHWGMEVNLLKAQVILSALFSHQTD